MQKKQTTEAKRTLALHVVLACALLVLAVLLVRSAVHQFTAGHMVSGCVSAVGGVLFFCVSLMLLNDLRRRRRGSHPTNEE